ncbi:unnamed protein product [Candida verbasci]|uniref:Electron transfer flavoprotein-ubiquinone oxidoreductase n=1 Tax=Candida verbasci TaxID=1227364 RepID=A0A9W4XBY3_9ASCO|nr:unnamed protein product [Candida verbasci]
MIKRIFTSIQVGSISRWTFQYIPKRFNSIPVERVKDFVDVCIIGGGPSGLSTAIKLKQLDQNDSLRVMILEKSSDFGSHIVSGAVIEPKSINELFPNEINPQGIALPSDLITKVTSDHMLYLTKNSSYSLPEPPQMTNKNKNFIVSLNNVVKYLSERAEELGVEMYPGISVSDVIYNKNKDGVIGVVTQDMGIDKNGVAKDSYEPGMEFYSRFTILAEGCHGSLSKKVINQFNLRKDSDPQTYGLGIKEVWEIEPSKFKRGEVLHSIGYPLSSDTYGGAFMYHFENNLISIGLVIGLDYSNPYISPYLEFQKLKKHPVYSDVLKGGKCISYAARALNEGGYQSIPKLTFKGGVLIGCSAGFMNVPKIKGTHTAIKSGIIAAEEIYKKVQHLDSVDEENFEDQEIIDLVEYETEFKKSWAYQELYEVRNVRPSFEKFGLIGGLIHSGISTMITNGNEPWTLHNKTPDYAKTKNAELYKPINYPKADNELTFDILTSVSRTGTFHDEDELCHLQLKSKSLKRHSKMNWEKYKGVEQRFCPAGVYEYLKDDKGDVKFQINSQNCIHCKTCDIKDPAQDINWQVPEGGDGPKYYMT